MKLLTLTIVAFLLVIGVLGLILLIPRSNVACANCALKYATPDGKSLTFVALIDGFSQNAGVTSVKLNFGAVTISFPIGENNIDRVFIHQGTEATSIDPVELTPISDGVAEKLSFAYSGKRAQFTMPTAAGKQDQLAIFANTKMELVSDAQKQIIMRQNNFWANCPQELTKIETVMKNGNNFWGRIYQFFWQKTDPNYIKCIPVISSLYII